MKPSILILLLFFWQSTIAQTYITTDIGIATYSMSDLKLLQKNIFEDTPVILNTVEKFPPFIQYQIGVKHYQASNIILGGEVLFTSTGGRIVYSDFSGSLRGDQLVNVFSAGPKVGYKISQSNKFALEIESLTSFDFTNLELKNSLIVGSQTDQSSEKFRAYGVSLYPRFNLNYSFKILVLYAFLGGQITVIQNPFIWKEDNESQITLDGKNGLKPQWSGLRSGIGIAFKL
jgi:hypothetical protein